MSKSAEQAIRKFVAKYVNNDNEPTLLPDLAALIKEYFVPKDEAYPKAFVEWLLNGYTFLKSDQSFVVNYPYMTKHNDYRHFTSDELYEYWKENEGEEEHPTNKEKFDGNYLPDPE